MCAERVGKQGNWVSPSPVSPVDSAVVCVLSHPEWGISQLSSAGQLSDLLWGHAGPDHGVLVMRKALLYFKVHHILWIKLCPLPSLQLC